MRFLVLSISLLFFISTLASAQIKVDSERDSDGNVLIFATNSEPIPYTVILNFTTLQNLSTAGGGNVTALAPPGRSQLTRLRPTVTGQGTSYNYSYSVAKGNIFAKTKEEPIFLIPVAAGTEVSAMKMTHIENRLGDERANDDYVGVSFRFKEPTPIVAPRKGVISSMDMSHEELRENLDFARSENHIEIYHEDGTFTKLMVLKKGSERVKLGDIVFPGDVIAESAGANYNSGLHVRLVTLKTEKDGMDKFKYTPIPVKFATEDGGFQISELVELDVVHPREVIELEMSKKELKKYAEQN